MIMRLIAALAVLVSGATHLKLWFDGERHTHIIGPLFMVNAVAGLVIAILLVTWRHWLPLLLAVGFGAATLGAFTISATAGLFGIKETWEGGPVWIAAISEAAAILAGIVAAAQEGYLRSRTASGSGRRAGVSP
jgi:hypothetical protein